MSEIHMMCVHMFNGVLMRVSPDGVSLEHYHETVLSLDCLFLGLQSVDRTFQAIHLRSLF